MKKLLIFCVVMFSYPAFAVVGDSDICFYHTTKAEAKKNIKKNILSTISLVETGRMSSKERPIGHPWPWTIAYQGKGHYFDTKEQAVKEVKELQKKGIKSIDVGCMQVNLFYHGEAFASIEEAFDPQTNVDYAGDFVNRLYKKHGNWGAAATAYHSHNPQKAHKYEDKLIKVWAGIERHLQDGGRLYNKPKTVTLTNALEIEKTPDIASVQDEPQKTEKLSLTQDMNDMTSADFARQWRARKLTEYRLRRGVKTLNSSQNKTNEGKNL